MTDKSEWQEANRRITAEQRERLGDPPTADELLAYERGTLSEAEEERIRDLLVAYPELAKAFAAPFPKEPEAGVSEERINAGLQEVRRRLSPVRMRRYIPTTIAAALALVFFGLYVQAENRARDNTRTCDVPRILGAPHELDPDGNRGPAAPTLLRKDDGDAYLLRLHVLNQVRYPHYTIELHNAKGAVWTSHSGQPDEGDWFQLVIPHAFLRAGAYQLRIFAMDGNDRHLVAAYDVAVEE